MMMKSKRDHSRQRIIFSRKFPLSIKKNLSGLLNEIWEDPSCSDFCFCSESKQNAGNIIIKNMFTLLVVLINKILTKSSLFTKCLYGNGWYGSSERL